VRGDEAALVVEGIKLAFGGQVVVDEVSLDVSAGELVGLVGPNGAGKTSVLNCLSGIYQPQRGRARLDGHDLLGTPPARRCRLGLGRTFQHMQLLDEHTCLENVLVGRHSHMRGGVFLNALYVGIAAAQERANAKMAEAALERCGVGEFRDSRISDLPYGLRKRVDAARALAMEPSVLLLDEPMAGLSGPEREAMVGVIEAIRSEGLTLVMIEHDIEIMRNLSDRMLVLDQGRVLAEGRPDDVLAEGSVREAFLGIGNEQERSKPNVD